MTSCFLFEKKQRRFVFFSPLRGYVHEELDKVNKDSVVNTFFCGTYQAKDEDRSSTALDLGEIRELQS
jgi:hypothetical protein